MVANWRRFLLYTRFALLMGVFAICALSLAQEENTPASPPPTTTPDAAPAADVQQSDRHMHIRSQRQVFSPGTGQYQFYGEVTVTRPGLELHASELSYDAKGEVMNATGEVALTREDGQTYRGESLEYHTVTGKWQFQDWKTVLSPETLGKPFIGPVFTTGEKVASGQKGGIDLTNTHITTCDAEKPHYEIVARDVDIYPGDKLVAKDVDLYVLGHRVLHLPWLFFLLRKDNLPLTPQFGRNDIEGYFVRLPYQYLLNPDNLGMLRLDVTEKRGLGFEVDHFYSLGAGNGEAFAYVSTGSSDYTYRLKHEQPLLPNLDLTVNLERERQRLNSTETITANSLLRLQRKTDHTSSQLEYTNNSTGGNYNLHSSRLTLRHDIKAGDNAFSYNGEYRNTAYGTTGTPADQELWNHLLFTRHLQLGNLALRVDEHADPDGSAYTGDSNVTHLERLPEMTFQTASALPGMAIPGHLTLGLGSYREHDSANPLGRLLFDWEATPSVSLAGNTTLQLTTGLRQTVYSDAGNSAQYQYDLGLNAQTKIGHLTNTLNYGLQHGAGYSPFYMDAVYPRHAVTNTLQYQTPALKLGLTGGRDLEWKRWNDIAFSAEMHAGDHFSMRQSLGYDPNLSIWRDLSSQFAWQQDPRFGLNLNTRYNLRDSKLRNASAQLNWAITPQWQVQWNASYDGAKFNWNEWLITRDLHCWEALLHFDSVNHQIGFTMRPKALDSSVVPEIGVGYGDRWNLSLGMQF